MKWAKLLVSILTIGGIILFSIGCSRNSTTAAKPQIVTVQKGNISTIVTGTGNLAYAKTQDMAFQTAGTVDRIDVSAGDTVKQGQELARLDTTVWDAQVKTLTKSLTSSQRTLANAQNNLATMQNNLIKAQRNVGAKQMAVSQAQLDLQSAQNALTNMADVKAAQDKIDQLQSDLDYAQSMLSRSAQPAAGIDVKYWNDALSNDKMLLVQAQKDLRAILTGTSTNVTADVDLQVTQTEFKVQQSQRALEDAQIAVSDAQTAVSTAQTAVTNAQLDINDAQGNVDDAQGNLDDAKAVSPVIIAPFDGFVTKVNSIGGDIVQKGTVAMQVADPTQFEANIMVSERDIFSVKIGGDASVSLDAMSGLSFPAKIANIAPLATIQQGVVNYQVTVELTSLRPTLTTGTLSSSRTTGQFPPGAQAALAGTGQARASATPTGSPAPSDSPSTTAAAPRSGNGGGALGGLLQPVTLKSGLSSTVNITIQEKNDVLLVPSRAISRQGRNSVVQVVTGTTTETRIVQTGVSDSANTEIVSGLNEGDQISVAGSSSATPTNRPGGIPGMGGGIRIGG
jgi:multidrug efflux pump subunit AcrA (membrane-fusion protein)